MYVPASSTPSGPVDEARDALLEAIREEIAHLRRESERKDAIIMSLLQANAEQARTIREIEAPKEPEEEPEKVAPHSATGEAQEGAEPLEQPSGWLAPVDKLPWWHYALGICSVFLTTFLTAFLGLSEGDPAAGDTGATINLATINLVEFAGLWAIPGVFGFWVGFRQRYSHLWSRIIPIGALLALMVGLGAGIPYEVWLIQSKVAAPENNISDFLLLVLGFGIFLGLPEWLLFVSAYLIGHARQRRRIGRISGTTPASPVSVLSKALRHNHVTI